jgi:peptidoglycan/xylan/chitin deacetylase (PgdA/CDA1 family)
VGVGARTPLVLAYHAVDSSWRSPLAIPKAALREQAAMLRRRGYIGLTASQAERLTADGSLPERAAVFTFDDGYASTERAAEVLADYGYPGTVFVVPPFVESGSPLSWFGVEHEESQHMRPLGWDQLSALSAAGWEVGSHTLTHALLTVADDAALSRELAESRSQVADRLGNCRAIAYPYGQADTRVAAAAREAGYEVGYTLTGAHTADEPLLRPRISLTGRDLGIRLHVKISPASRAARRSAAARLARRARRPRPWIPPNMSESGGT